MASIARFGFRVPLVVNRLTNIIEARNTRWKAAHHMGLAEVPAIFADDDEVTALAFALADSRTAETAQWDEPSLAALPKRLDAAGELASSAFSDDDLTGLLARLDARQKSGRDESFDADQAMTKAEQQRGQTRVQPGELWQLGRHHLPCGDSTDSDAVTRLMAGATACLVATDPPYGVAYDGNAHRREPGGASSIAPSRTTILTRQRWSPSSPTPSSPPSPTSPMTPPGVYGMPASRGRRH
jgi:hypothetical protein